MFLDDEVRLPLDETKKQILKNLQVRSITKPALIDSCRQCLLSVLFHGTSTFLGSGEARLRDEQGRVPGHNQLPRKGHRQPETLQVTGIHLLNLLY